MNGMLVNQKSKNTKPSLSGTRTEANQKDSNGDNLVNICKTEQIDKEEDWSAMVFMNKEFGARGFQHMYVSEIGNQVLPLPVDILKCHIE